MSFWLECFIVQGSTTLHTVTWLTLTGCNCALPKESRQQLHRDNSPKDKHIFVNTFFLLPLLLFICLERFAAGYQVLEISTIEMCAFSLPNYTSSQKEMYVYSRTRVLCSGIRRENSAYMKLLTTRSVDYLELPDHHIFFGSLSTTS